MHRFVHAAIFLTLIIGLNIVCYELIKPVNEANLETVIIYSFVPKELLDGITSGDIYALSKVAINSITHTFVHASYNHLASNMLHLIPAALGVIYFTGLFRGTLFFFLFGIAGSLTHFAFFSYSEIPMLGASGCVFGFMGMFVAFNITPMIKIELGERLSAISIAPLAFFMISGIREIALSVVTVVMEVDFGIAHLAHAGGFIAGIAIGLLFFFSYRSKLKNE